MFGLFLLGSFWVVGTSLGLLLPELSSCSSSVGSAACTIRTGYRIEGSVQSVGFINRLNWACVYFGSLVLSMLLLSLWFCVGLGFVHTHLLSVFNLLGSAHSFFPIFSVSWFLARLTFLSSVYICNLLVFPV